MLSINDISSNKSLKDNTVPLMGMDPDLFRQFLVWRERIILDLTSQVEQDTNLSMDGRIRTKEKCPKCKRSFTDTGRSFVCTKCLTIPLKFFVDVHWRGQRYKFYTDQDGHTLSSYDHAFRILTQIRNEIDRKAFHPDDYVPKFYRKLQFENYCREWLKRYKKLFDNGEISPTYYRNLINYAENHFIPFFDITDIREIRAGDINDLYLNLPNNLSIKTKSNIMAALKKIFNDAHFDEYIQRIPRFKKVTIPDPKWQWVDEDIQDQVLDKIPTHHLPVFIFLTRQGVRPGEARALQWQDIDIKNNLVTICRAFSENTLRPFPKPRRNKTLPLDPEVKEILKSMPITIKKDDFVFYDQDLQKPYTTYKLSKLWRKASKQVGVDITFYEGTRHSFASQAVNRGVNIDLIGKFLGHQNRSSTERYAHLKIDSLKVVMRKNRVRKIKDSDKKILELSPNRPQKETGSK